MNRFLGAFAVSAAYLALSIVAHAQPCEPHWTTDFAHGGTDGPVSSMAVFDDGSGPALYLAGEFQHVGALPCNGIARWDGTSLTPVPSNPPWGAQSMVAFDDGSGPALYAAASEVWKLHAGTWTQVLGSRQVSISLLAVHDDSAGPHLYGIAQFGPLYPVEPPPCVARWSGTDWEQLPGDFANGANTAFLYCMQSVDLGAGPNLYVGGSFTSIGATPINALARWNGATWIPAAAGLSGGSFGIGAMASLDMGSGPEIFVRGSFSTAGGEATRGLARFDGSAWHSLGSPVAIWMGSMTAMQTSRGPRLFVIGEFTFPGPFCEDLLGMWDGHTWSSPNTGDCSFRRQVKTLLPYDDGTGLKLYAGGEFGQIGQTGADNIAAFDGAAWTPLAPSRGISDWVDCAATFDGGHGPAVYCGGSFEHAGGRTVAGFARWDGRAWAPAGEGIMTYARSMAIFDDGRGLALYMAGTSPGLLPQFPPGPTLARWDGRTWEPVPLPTGAQWLGPIGVGDDGSGPALFIGGSLPGGIMKWDGHNLTPLGAGLGAFGGPRVSAIVSIREQGRPVLYVGGEFTTAGGMPAHNLARWDGQHWSATSLLSSAWITSLAAAPAPDRDILYVGGQGLHGSGWYASIAAWDGETWSRVGDLSGSVNTLRVFDVGDGPQLFAAGPFDVGGVAKWDGLSWLPLDASGQTYDSWDGDIRAMTTFTDSNGPSIVVGGEFQRAAGLPAAHIARWIACPAGVCYANCDASTTPPVLNVNDFFCFLNRFIAADAYANCDHSTTPPTLNVNDFMCFLNRFAAGCP